MPDKELAAAAKAKGNEFFKDQNYAEAIKHFTEAIKHDDTDHVFYSNRSACFASLEKYDKAYADGKKCVELKPDWAKGYTRKGLAEFFLEKYNDAADTYKAGLKLSPDDAAMKEGLQKAIVMAKKKTNKKPEPDAAAAAAAAASAAVENVDIPNPEDLRPKGMSTLADAAWDGEIETVKSLVEKGAQIESKDEAGRTVLALAAIQKQMEVLKFLIEKKADVNAKDDAGITALIWCARAGNVDEVNVLIAAGADLEAADADGMTATKLAALFNHVSVVQALVEGGADPKPALELAKKFKQAADAVRYLLKVVLAPELEAKADVTAEVGEGPKEEV